ncbi:MAG TPA: hypothetical protein PLV73_00330 [Treponemataceae bacterium]|jgi:hypothetical protein|nr:MAG: hypothetical protein BWY20_00924 [Spirochaetes bacterium ADurb.Bin215]HOF85026.1 hypothetical protein [Treponemataceae bacterium]HOU39195.1 hypothetical protein [Treponemataceae bacterium]HPA09244.1 hypothetical protein [Treponemataceae bacterium]HPX13041.1 hypothetical protein [Treponemataceae bacterium]
MDKNAVCHQCGRTVDASFIYCPWCGTVSEELVSFALHMDSVFSGSFGGVLPEEDASRIARMENTLGTLEQELTLLMSEAHLT